MDKHANYNCEVLHPGSTSAVKPKPHPRNQNLEQPPCNIYTWVTLSASKKNVISIKHVFWKNGRWHRRNNSIPQFSTFGKNAFLKRRRNLACFFTFPTCSLFLVYATPSKWSKHVGLKACVPKSRADFNAVQSDPFF